VPVPGNTLTMIVHVTGGELKSDTVMVTVCVPGVKNWLSVGSTTVGSDGSFGEHAELPTNLGEGERPTKAVRTSNDRKAKKTFSRPLDKATERKATLAFEKEQKRRERERATEEAARQKERERRQQAVGKARAALETAEREHAKRAAAIQVEVDALEKKSQAEDPGGTRKKRASKPHCEAREASSRGFGRERMKEGSVSRSIWSTSRIRGKYRR
jgi:hypothetical protein